MPPQRLNNKPGKVLLNVLIKKLTGHPDSKNILPNRKRLNGLEKHRYRGSADIFPKDL
jgi:hypothetical protein